MKKYYKLILLAGIISVAGCEKDLDLDPVGAVTLEQAGNTPTTAIMENLTRASYDLLSNRLNILGNWDWGGGLVFQPDYIMQDIASDDMERKWNPDGDQLWIDEINNFTFTSSNGGPNGLWRYDYQAIKRLNTAIEHLQNPDIESITGITTTGKNQLMGECYFLRSYYYFSLVTNFGDVPLIVRPVKSFDEAFEVAVRADKSLVWAQIKNDLVLSRDLLPNSKYSSDTEKWRASRGAAIALLAKSELYTQNWAAVPALVDQLSALGFSLDANYFDNFSTEFTDNEVIFAFDHQTNATPRRGNGICAPLGWGFFAPSTDFLNAFEPNDPRKSLTVNVADQNVNKMLGSLNGANKGNDDAPNNKIYIRYADALLWKAEALNETGDYAGAVAIINQIRKRARTSPAADGVLPPAGTLPDRPASSDKAIIKGWLISERRVELGFENQRMLDLKRWGIAKQVMNAAGKNFQDKHMLYPIPQTEIETSAGTLTQNPGY
ncbi:membrane protein [Flavobacterium noncentrifugens]|uniref:Starch-binding associating with outer membrane n=1 Tax=Flavobacterium noncentrifugens TaxID=1128970 RepID=A0A1G8ZQH7_9FLAO|nr:RagB/SusD family nutrient uptake outer membrane protein [Flavobacterium noncentrifugens]GEP51888.1 membrane protein [Flavobacterium noncentrifugens]SDK16824.1 Starch-binding associating with outer membrane [Flavobacterium noncentrifugens]